LNGFEEDDEEVVVVLWGCVKKGTPMHTTFAMFEPL